VHHQWIVTLDEVRVVPVASQQIGQLAAADARQHGRVRDLETVQVQDRQDDTVACGVQELVGMPARCQRSGLRFAISDDTGDDQVRIVERGAVRMGERVAELPALVDRAGHFR